MAADVVKDVGFLQVIELITAADEAGRRKTAGREKREKHIVGHQAGHRGDAPAGGAVENVAEPAEIRDAVGRNPKALQTIEIFAAGAALQELLLALEQEPPDGVLILAIAGPVLLDRMIPQPAAHRVLRKVLPLHLGTPGRRFNRADGPIRTVCRVTRDT